MHFLTSEAIFEDFGFVNHARQLKVGQYCKFLNLEEPIKSKITQILEKLKGLLLLSLLSCITEI